MQIHGCLLLLTKIKKAMSRYLSSILTWLFYIRQMNKTYDFIFHRM